MASKILRMATISSILLVLALTASAARRLEKRESATHVFTGKVRTLHRERNRGFLDYTVDVKVTSIEKGEGLKVRDVVPIRCYLRDPDWLKGKTIGDEERRKDGLRRDSSYLAVPKEGDEIKVYARKDHEKFEGIYPDWFDEIKK